MNDAIEMIMELINYQDPLDTSLVNYAYERASEDYIARHSDN